MRIEALPFVNWIFWASLASGTLLAVGATELLGGTTRGYRLFMACFAAALAAILLLSELNLPAGTVADATAGVRRWLVIGSVASAAAYLLGSVLRAPRSGLALLGGAIGLGSLLSLAVAGGTRSAPLFALQLTLASVVLGSVTAAMLLGHWYLVTPRLSPLPLRRLIGVAIVGLGAQALAFGIAQLTVGPTPVGSGIGWLVWLRLVAGTLLPIATVVLAMLATRAASLQASTGLLYIGLALVMAGCIAGASLSYLTGVPV
ncbi:MAG: hypothetical protein M3Y88_06890 [Chloroflexota bacterium]|nr:hypothetical protein [Chloroflexota bacterium]